MSSSPSSRSGLAALRPWPFGPPLRGRAPRGEAGPRAACTQATPASDTSPGRPATAPVGGRACGHTPCCAL